MDLSKIPLFAQLKGKMAWLSQRQKVLAENIANADTPGYVPRDLKPVDFSREIAAVQRKLKVASTRQGHITPKVPSAQFRSDEQREPPQARMEDQRDRPPGYQRADRAP